ncbi:MAG: HlyD family secretion protein [Verrucomicrobia bacterium]|nr:HlyD family secretion protein [Verrucomicrobiota bacterium]
MPAEDAKTQAPEKSANAEAPKPATPLPRKRRRWALPLIVLVAIGILAVGIPKVLRALNTVSTDDAYVNSYVTFVAPRVAGQVARVQVEDNNRVKKGAVLVELDPEPYRVQVEIKQATVDAAQADLVVAEASVRGEVAQTRSGRFKLVHAIEDVDNQIATIRARVATWEESKATLVLAQAEFDRTERLVATKVVSSEQYDQKREALDVAKAQVRQSLENIHQARVALGLPAEPAPGASLADVPANLDQNTSSVREALADLLQSAAKLGLVPPSYDLMPKEVIADFYKRDPGGDINRIYAAVIQNAPDLKRAQASLLQAQRDLDQAKLDLRYCTIVAEIDGVVTRRNVNPGNNVQVGQSLMAIRSLKDIWVDANFKETQLRNLRIGQRVDLKLDMYGGKRTFEGRISGFTNGTGSTLSLLPAQNATGNFVKVVQRLPVRIELTNYDPDKAPLFVGLSVTPSVDLQTAPTGPHAGKFLQAEAEADSAAGDKPATP